MVRDPEASRGEGRHVEHGSDAVSAAAEQGNTDAIPADGRWVVTRAMQREPDEMRVERVRVFVKAALVQKLVAE